MDAGGEAEHARLESDHRYRSFPHQTHPGLHRVTSKDISPTFRTVDMPD